MVRILLWVVDGLINHCFHLGPDMDDDEDEMADDDEIDPIPSELIFLAHVLWSTKDEWTKWKEYFVNYEKENKAKLDKLRAYLQGAGADDEDEEEEAPKPKKSTKIEELPDEPKKDAPKPAAEEKKTEEKKADAPAATTAPAATAAPASTFSFQPGAFNFNFDASAVQSAIDNMQTKPTTSFTFSAPATSSDGGLADSLKKGATKHAEGEHKHGPGCAHGHGHGHGHRHHHHHHDEDEDDEDGEFDFNNPAMLQDLMGGEGTHLLSLEGLDHISFTHQPFRIGTPYC